MENMSNASISNVQPSIGVYSNFTVEEASITEPIEIIGFIIVCFVLGILIAATIVGNVFVMVAIVKDRNLNNISNYLVFSLALADLLVALLVMPIGAVYEVKQEWNMGPVLCDLWTSCDVLCCTASILHLLAIAVDRYWAVTNVDYARNRSKNRIYTMIVVVWTVSFAVSIAPIFGWKDPDFSYRIEIEKKCLVSQDIGYQIFATCSSFYVPLVMILILYSRIYQEARKRIRKRPGAASQAMLLVQRPPPALTSSKRSNSSPSSSFNSPSHVIDTTLSCSLKEKNATIPEGANGISSNKTVENSQPSSSHISAGTVGRLLHIGKREKKPENNLAKRERKAAKTLAIITGVFVMCWLPFFIMALLLPLCKECEPNFPLFSIFLWLGYANSTLNPIIYTIFSPDFRSAFRKLLCAFSTSQRPSL